MNNFSSFPTAASFPSNSLSHNVLSYRYCCFRWHQLLSMKSHLKFPNARSQTNVTKRKTASAKNRACLAALGRSKWPPKFFQLCVFVSAAFPEAAPARCSPVGMQRFSARARNQLARPVKFISILNMCTRTRNQVQVVELCCCVCCFRKA